MKIKAGTDVYDVDDVPVMIIFDSKKEREVVIEHLKNMPDEYTKYCLYPLNGEWDKDKISDWMDECD